MITSQNFAWESFGVGGAAATNALGNGRLDPAAARLFRSGPFQRRWCNVGGDFRHADDGGIQRFAGRRLDERADVTRCGGKDFDEFFARLTDASQPGSEIFHDRIGAVAGNVVGSAIFAALPGGLPLHRVV